MECSAITIESLREAFVRFCGHYARERLVAAGLEVVESTPTQYAAFRKADLARWARMIKETNVRMEP